MIKAFVGCSGGCMFERFTADSRRTLGLAQDCAGARDSVVVEGRDLLAGMALLSHGPVPGLLRQAGLVEAGDAQGARSTAAEKPRCLPVELSQEVKSGLEGSIWAALAGRDETITPLHLLVGLLTVPDSTARAALLRCGADPDGLADAARRILLGPEPTTSRRPWWSPRRRSR